MCLFLSIPIPFLYHHIEKGSLSTISLLCVLLNEKKIFFSDYKSSLCQSKVLKTI